jgi:hypothetical protein
VPVGVVRVRMVAMMISISSLPSVTVHSGQLWRWYDMDMTYKQPCDPTRRPRILGLAMSICSDFHFGIGLPNANWPMTLPMLAPAFTNPSKFVGR